MPDLLAVVFAFTKLDPQTWTFGMARVCAVLQHILEHEPARPGHEHRRDINPLRVICCRVSGDQRGKMCEMYVPGENIVMRPSRFRPSSSGSPTRNSPSPTITPAAPRSCAARTLTANSHPPRSTSAILYGLEGVVYRIGGHAGDIHAMSGCSASCVGCLP